MWIQNETLSGIKKYLGWFYGDVLANTRYFVLSNNLPHLINLLKPLFEIFNNSQASYSKINSLINKMSP